MASSTQSFREFEQAGWENPRVVIKYHEHLSAVTTQSIGALLDAAGVREGSRLLDVATGAGYVAGAAAQRGAKATGIDFSAAQVRMARDTYPAVQFEQADAEALPQEGAHWVLDEADEMLDMGFIDDILKITTYLPKKRQTLMFSATMPPKIRMLATKLLVNPEQISLAVSKPAEGVIQGAYLVYDTQKPELTRILFEGKEVSSAIIFASTKQKVKELERTLQKTGLKAKAIHSDLEQAERESVLRDFRSKNLRILVATDILSRGIDIEDIGLVINYDVPGDAADYIHRIGRTARAASTGVALTYINEFDQQKFLQIETLIGSEVKKLALPETIGAGPVYAPEVKVKKPFAGKKRNFSKPRRKNTAK